MQLPEPCEETSEAFKAGFRTIADITRERVRRAAKQIKEKNATSLDLDGKAEQDLGFRAFRLAESNLKPWDGKLGNDAKALAENLTLHIDHIRHDRTPDDILFEILLKAGFPLTTHVENLQIAEKTVYSVAEGTLVICLEDELTFEVIRGIAELKPERVVMLDSGFAGNDQLKTNAVQTFKTKGVESFKVV